MHPILAAYSVICLFRLLNFVLPLIAVKSRVTAQGTAVAHKPKENRTDFGAVQFLELF
jgi:hypothetical protein